MSGLCIGPRRFLTEKFSHYDSEGNLNNGNLSTMKKILVISAFVFLICAVTSHGLTYWNIPQVFQWTIAPLWVGSIAGLCWSGGWINDHLHLSLERRASI